MKYTRYNLKPKRKKNNNFLLYLAVTLLLALVLGTLINKAIKNSGALWFQNGNQQEIEKAQEENKASQEEPNKTAEDDKKPGTDDAVKQEGENQSEYEFYIVQCGVFKVKDNADKVINKIGSSYSAFVVPDGELNKVYAGIYPKDKCDEAVNALKDKGIECSRVSVVIKSKDLSSVQLSKGIDGLLQVVGKLKESGVASVKSADLKAWCEQLEPIEESMADYNEAKEVKDYIAGLPEEVEKSGTTEILQKIFSIVVKYKK